MKLNKLSLNEIKLIRKGLTKITSVETTDHRLLRLFKKLDQFELKIIEKYLDTSINTIQTYCNLFENCQEGCKFWNDGCILTSLPDEWPNNITRKDN